MKRFGFVAAVVLLLSGGALAQAQPPPAGTSTPLRYGGPMMQLRGAEADLKTLQDGQFALTWKTTPNVYDALWVGTKSGGNKLVLRFPVVFPAPPAIPTTLPPTGPASGRLTGTYPSPFLAASGVTAATYGDSGHYPVLQIAADGTVSGASLLPLPAVPVIPSSLPPNGPATGDLTGTYPGPSLVSSGVTAGTYGSSTQVARVTIDAKGRVTNAANVTIADPWAAKIRTSRVTVPSLLGLAVSDVTVTWSTPFADTNYTPSIAVQQSGALAGILVDWCMVGQTATGITVRLKNVGLSAQSPVIHATAIHD